MADFDSTSYVQRRNLDDFPAKYCPASEFFFKIDILLKTFWAKSIYIYPALELTGKKYTQENGTSPDTPT